MKYARKIIALILVFAFAFSAFSVNAFARDTKTENLIAKIKSNKEVKVVFTAGDTALGKSVDAVAVKGNVIAYEYNTGFVTARVVYKDGVAYGYLPIFPFVYIKADNFGINITDVWSMIESASGITFSVMNYIKSYNENLYGTDYYVEEYNDRAQVTTKFCYVGDELKLISVFDAASNSTQNTYIESISLTVSDSDVAVPVGLDLGPVFKSILLGMLTSSLLY